MKEIEKRAAVSQEIILTFKNSSNQTKKQELKLQNKDNQFSTGLYVIDGISGIGTLTYYNPSTKRFGALGHMMNDNSLSVDIDEVKGAIYQSKVVRIVKSKSKNPGEKIAEISDINFKFDLKVNIGQYSNSAIDSYIAEYIYNYNLCKDQIKRNPFFTAASRGELNTCTLFTYAAYQLLSKDGVLGLVVKSSILTSPINKDFFAKIKLNTQYVYDFINKKKIFNIDCRERFSLLILNSRPCSNISLGMNILNIEDLDKGISTFSNDLLDVLNPDTGMLPNIDSSEDLAVLINIYKNNRV